MRTRSIAPGAARWPEEISAPSKAGPVGEEAATTRCSVAQYDFGIGADIDQKHHPVLAIRPFGKRGTGCVGADMAGDAGQHIEAGAAVDVDIDLMRPILQSPGNGERKRRLAKLRRVDAEEQMVHDRVADEDHVENVVAVDFAFFADLADQRR